MSSKVYLATKNDLGVLQTTGVGVGEVGVVTWQYTLLANHLKLDGTTVLGAEYPLLLAFAVGHELVTMDADNKVLFKYDETTDVLTLPDLMDLCVQGGINVAQVAASLPNIKGSVTLDATSTGWQVNSSNTQSSTSALQFSDFSKKLWGANSDPNVQANTMTIDASKYNSIYSDNTTTVQPPAVKLIPQIRYAADATTSFIDMVGHVLYDVVLRDGFIKANGAAVEYASTAVPRLVAFVREHTELLGDGPALYKYAEVEDTLTLPNFTARVLQGGDSVGSLEAGLPNIEGSKSLMAPISSKAGCFSDSYQTYPDKQASGATSEYWREVSLVFNAARSNSIYGASSTVQPPAITLIPQIKY